MTLALGPDRPLFGGVKERLDRADAHIKMFQTDAQTIGKQNPYRIAYDIEQGGRRHVFRLRFNVEFPLIRWSLLMGECVYNLRCALDYCVYLMGIEASGSNPPPGGDSLAFPIADDETKFPAASRRKDPLAALRTDKTGMIAAIKAAQPDPSKTGDSPPALSLLRDLNNADKHRMLSVMVGQTHGSGGISLRGVPNSPGQTVSVDHIAAPLVDGTPIATFTFANPIPTKMQVNADVSIAPAFRHGPFPDGRTHSDIDWALPYMRDEVRRVVGTLRPFM